MDVQLELEIDPPAKVYVTKVALWSRVPSIGEHVTIHGLVLGRVRDVIWPITDREDVVVRVAPDYDEGDVEPTPEQLASMGWRRA